MNQSPVGLSAPCGRGVLLLGRPCLRWFPAVTAQNRKKPDALMNKVAAESACYNNAALAAFDE